MSQSWKGDYFGCVSIENRDVEVQNILSQKMFQKTFDNLSLEQRWKITGKADILGSLTQDGYGAILNMDETKKAFNSIKKERDSITINEWEKIINGSKYRISYWDS